MKAYGRRGGINPVILNLGIRYKWVFGPSPRPLYSVERAPGILGKGTRYPLTRRMGGRHSPAGFFTEKRTLNCFGNRNTIAWCSNSLPSHYSKYPKGEEVTTLQAPFWSLPNNNLTVFFKTGFLWLALYPAFRIRVFHNISSSFSTRKISPSARNFLEIRPSTSTIHPNPTQNLLQFQCFKFGYVDNCHKLEYLV